MNNLEKTRKEFTTVLAALGVVNLLLVIPDRQRKLKDVVRLAELNLFRPIARWFQPVYDHIKRTAP